MSRIQSERIRVEQLLCDYHEACCCQDAQFLCSAIKPLSFRLSGHNTQRLFGSDGTESSPYGQLLQFFGFSWEPAEELSAGGPAIGSVIVKAVPRIVSERLATDLPSIQSAFREVLELDDAQLASTLHWARSQHAAHLAQKRTHQQDGDDSPSAPQSWQDGQDDVKWLSMLRYLPPTLRSLIESKACRGAISECIAFSGITCLSTSSGRSVHSRPPLLTLCHLLRAVVPMSGWQCSTTRWPCRSARSWSTT